METVRKVSEWLSALIGIGFIAGGGAKLDDPARAVAVFASWGVPGGWVILAAGWVEVALGLALLNRPTRPLGALGLSVWMLAWGTIQLLARSSAVVASAAVLALMALYLTAWRAPLRRAGVRTRAALRPDGPWVESPLEARPSTFAASARRLVSMVGLAFLIRWAVGGVMYWLALPLIARFSVRSGGSTWEERLETTLLHLLVLGLGVSGIWSFVGHTFMAETVSQSVGWATSPFQRELAYYHLAIGLSGIACWWIRDHFWLAATAIPSIFLYGAGVVHLVDFVRYGNSAPANWGFSVLFGDLILPTALLALAVIRSRQVSLRTVGRPEA